MATRGRTQARYIRRLQKALVELRTDAERREVLRVEALKRAVTAESELAVLKAAARAVAAEREAHEKTRADLREERQRTWEYVAYAATLKDVCDDLEERDGQFKDLIEQALAAEREARSEQEALRAKSVEASAAADKSFASMLDAWAERDAALTALARLDGLAKP
jgi:small-conductance mechanosensitive channel